ncbi:dienelactone hydrolase family protein [Thozetella sp. PMI_491]|nr:dienelactone hydrolase family protein [Thozetella sp. PMI_491]
MASVACAQLPSVTAEYTAKGRYETIAGLKTYVVGPADAKRAIIDIYDIFGIAPQTIQGADRLSAHLDALVLLPDFFNGAAAQDAWFPPDTDEKKALMKQFMTDVANVGAVVEKLIEVRKELGEKWPSVDDHVGAFGLCFGGKVAVLASAADNVGPLRRFTVTGTGHPGRLDAEDAKALNAPHICLASYGEPADIVAQYKEILSQPGKTGEVETYSTMHHGWMGARAKLGDPENLKEFERGYTQIAEFFAKHL